MRHLRGWALVPWVSIAVLALPVLAGLAGVVAPAFGYMPALGGMLSRWTHGARPLAGRACLPRCACLLSRV